MFEQLNTYLNGELRDAGFEKWLYYPEGLPVIIQMERFVDKSFILYCSFNRGGNGLFLASFLNLLLTEDIHAVADDKSDQAIECVSGSVSLTYFQRLNKDITSAKQIALSCRRFAEMVSFIAADTMVPLSKSEDRLKPMSLSDSRLTYLFDAIDDV